MSKPNIRVRTIHILQERIDELRAIIEKLTVDMLREENTQCLKGLYATRKMAEERLRDNRKLYRKVYGCEY